MNQLIRDGNKTDWSLVWAVNTSTVGDRIGRQEVLLPILHQNYDKICKGNPPSIISLNNNKKDYR